MNNALLYNTHIGNALNVIREMVSAGEIPAAAIDHQGNPVPGGEKLLIVISETARSFGVDSFDLLHAYQATRNNPE